MPTYLETTGRGLFEHGISIRVMVASGVQTNECERCGHRWVSEARVIR